MKLLEILQSTAARAVDIVAPTDAKFYGGNLVRAVNERYGFLESPTRMSDYDYRSGVKFLQGMFDGKAVDMEILESGIKVACKAGTEVCDAFLDDLLSAAKRFGVRFEDGADLRVYSSAVEFEMNGEFNSLFSKISKIGELIGGDIARYGGPGDTYRAIGMVFASNLQGPAPDPFKIERRTGHPLDSNVFFSIAPLRNDHHLNVLREFERLIS